MAYYDSSYPRSYAWLFGGVGVAGLLCCVYLAVTAPARIRHELDVLIVVLMVLPVLSLARGTIHYFAYQRQRCIEERGELAWARITGLRKTSRRVRVDLGGGRTSGALAVYDIELSVPREGATNNYRYPAGPNTIVSHAQDTLPQNVPEAQLLAQEWQVKLHPEEPTHAAIEWQLGSRPLEG
jgi:hypothetical protein